jgi:hypothetical protein
MRIALAVVAAACGLAASSVAAAPGFTLESWSDLDHAWASVGSVVYATSDGGKTWRPVFSGGAQIFRIVRTSVNAGIVVTGESKPVTFWTRDAGHHWYRGVELFSTAAGHGNQLFVAFAGALQQLKPWPPRGAARCAGTWWASAFGPGANPKAPKNVCSVPTPVALQKAAVVNLTKGEFAPDTLTAVPGGIAAVVTDGSVRNRPLSVVVYRSGHGAETALPSSLPPDAGFSGLQLFAAWPTLRLDAVAGGAHVTWGSSDGGDSWFVIR